MEARRTKRPRPHLSQTSAAASPAPPARGVTSNQPWTLVGITDRASLLRDDNGRATHAVFSYDDYVQLSVLQAAWEAEPILDDPNTEWFDLEDVVPQWNVKRLVAARKSRNLTQAQLGKLVGMPQSQISRLEKNPDASSLRLIKKIAKALKIPARDLI